METYKFVDKKEIASQALNDSNTHATRICRLACQE